MVEAEMGEVVNQDPFKLIEQTYALISQGLNLPCATQMTQWQEYWCPQMTQWQEYWCPQMTQWQEYLCPQMTQARVLVPPDDKQGCLQ
ncbi:hypothetical protein ACOMHN_017013 [Nucella lapillus]